MAIPTKGRLIRSLRGFHDDEGGMEALQVVLIIAIAAAILIVAYKTMWTGKIEVNANSVIDKFTTEALSEH